MTQSVVSVIIPTHNYAHYLGGALESVLAQTLQDWELVVIDDGSTDDPRAVVAQFHDSRIHLLRQEKQGPAAARNAGLRVARAAAIAFLDADDRWEPLFLETLMAALQASKSAPFVCCGYGFLDEQGNRLPRVVKKPALSDNWVDNLRYGRNPLLHTVIARREVCIGLGGFDPSLRSREDWDFWLRAVASYGPPGIVEGALALYRMHNASRSANLEYRLDDARRIVAKHALAAKSCGVEEAELRATTLTTAYLVCVVESMIAGDTDGTLRWFTEGLREYPALATRDDTVYELCCGRQPHGERGLIERLNLPTVLSEALSLVQRAEDTIGPPVSRVSWSELRARLYLQAAQFALVQQDLRLARTYTQQALVHNPGALLSRRDLPRFLRIVRAAIRPRTRTPISQ